MILEELSLKQLLELAHRAEEMCLRRLGEIHAASDPTDEALQDLLADLSSEVINHANSVWEYRARVECADSGPLPPEDAERLILWRLPSIARSLGEGVLDRDLALFFAESMEEEATRFYRALSQHAPDGESLGFFLNMAERDRVSLDHLRQVVLQG
ncbi:MAG TPA: hypothetical protein VEN81_16780 [Planctomycetota bacterium]|nr:hypothetical protein [Planctomycetota bacterium]